MSEFRVITNNVPRDVISDYELSAAERKAFDYLNWEAIDKGEDSASFFRYRGSLYDLGEFTSTVQSGYGFSSLPADSPLLAWDGYLTDSYFSAVVVRWVRDEFRGIDADRIVVGMVLS